MADTKLSLEDILDEYKTDPNDSSTAHVGRVDAQKIINSTLPDPVKIAAEIPKAVSHEKNELFDSDEIKGIPANEIRPAELSRKTAAVAGEDGIKEVRSAHPADMCPEAKITDGSPKIRPMSESTRARKNGSPRKKQKRLTQRKRRRVSTCISLPR